MSTCWVAAFFLVLQAVSSSWLSSVTPRPFLWLAGRQPPSRHLALHLIFPSSSNLRLQFALQNHAHCFFSNRHSRTGMKWTNPLATITSSAEAAAPTAQTRPFWGPAALMLPTTAIWRRGRSASRCPLAIVSVLCTVPIIPRRKWVPCCLRAALPEEKHWEPFFIRLRRSRLAAGTHTCGHKKPPKVSPVCLAWTAL